MCEIGDGEEERKLGRPIEMLLQWFQGKDGGLKQVVAVRWKDIHKVELTGLGKLTESGR